MLNFKNRKSSQNATSSKTYVRNSRHQILPSPLRGSAQDMVSSWEKTPYLLENHVKCISCVNNSNTPGLELCSQHVYTNTNVRTLCIWYCFSCGMRFYRHESPNPARVAKRRGRDLVTSDGKTHTARKTIPYAFSRTLR